MAYFSDTEDRSKRIAFFLEEGLFERKEGIKEGGSDYFYDNITADAGKKIMKGDAVKLTNTPRTVVKATDNEYLGVVLADPEGVPPLSATDVKRRATITIVQPGEFYHVELKPNNTAVTAGTGYIVWDGAGFDVTNTAPTKGAVLIPIDSAAANTGKRIDCYCKAVL